VVLMILVTTNPGIWRNKNRCNSVTIKRKKKIIQKSPSLQKKLKTEKVSNWVISYSF